MIGLISILMKFVNVANLSNVEVVNTTNVHEMSGNACINRQLMQMIMHGFVDMLYLDDFDK